MAAGVRRPVADTRPPVQSTASVNRGPRLRRAAGGALIGPATGLLRPPGSDDCARRRARRPCVGGGAALGAALPGGLVRGAAPAQVAGGVGQADVAERLRRVADLPLRPDVVLLAEQPEVVPQRQQPLEEPLGLVLPLQPGV